MKISTIFLSILLLFSISCTNEESEKHAQLSDPEGFNMKIIPLNPSSSDSIQLVVFDDCKYNILSGVTRDGNIIEITKQFNSMMKWPCMIHNDSILIGKLPAGSYIVNYKLIDLSTLVPDPIALSLFFSLTVLK